MTTTINASPSNGLVQTADGSGILKVQSNGVTTNALAWANFSNVGGAITIRSSYNLSSITYSSGQVFILNFANTLSDTNYVVLGVSGQTGSNTNSGVISSGTPSNSSYSNKTTSAVTLVSTTFNNAAVAYFDNNVVVFGN